MSWQFICVSHLMPSYSVQIIATRSWLLGTKAIVKRCCVRSLHIIHYSLRNTLHIFELILSMWCLMKMVQTNNISQFNHTNSFCGGSTNRGENKKSFYRKHFQLYFFWISLLHCDWISKIFSPWMQLTMKQHSLFRQLVGWLASNYDKPSSQPEMVNYTGTYMRHSA